MTRKRIGLIIPEFSDTLDLELLDGIYQQAKKLGYDLIVLTGIIHAQVNETQNDYVKGEKNIFNLAAIADFDGLLFAAERFKNIEIQGEIYDTLKTTSVPCLVLAEENEYFPYIFAPQKDSIHKITNHLIHQHNCQKIYCLTGPEGQYEAEERLSGYCEALFENNIPIEADHIFYGDFWREIPYELGNKIACGEIAKPDAIVCTSDVMAMALCDSLQKNGIAVPQDIAITGYDGSLFTSMYTPTITTISGRDTYLGKISVCRLHEMITGISCHYPDDAQIFHHRTSCGCISETSSALDTSLLSQLQRLMQQKLNRKSYLTSNYISKFSEINSFQQFLTVTDSLGYLLQNWEQLSICLCEDWKIPFQNPKMYRKKGFSDKMLLAVSKQDNHDEIAQYTFNTAQLLPALSEPHDPCFVVCTSLHSGNQIFGYIASSYQNTDDFWLDEHYINWCDAVANGLHNLQRNMYTNSMLQHLENNSLYHFDTGLMNKHGFFKKLPLFTNILKQKGSLCFLICLSYSEESDATSNSEFGIHTSLLFANALRLSCNPHELIAQYDNQIFVVALEIPAMNTAPDYFTEWLMHFKQNIYSLRQGNLKHQSLEPLYEYCTLEPENLMLAEEILSQQSQRLTQKRKSNTLPVGSYTDALNQLRHEIKISLQHNYSISELATKIGVSNSHFQRLYKTQFSVPCMEDMIQMRIDKAKYLLSHTQLRVHEIAEQCGYQNVNHFIRQFKDRVGISSMQYRKIKRK